MPSPPEFTDRSCKIRAIKIQHQVITHNLCTTNGNIYSFRKELNGDGNWNQPVRVNDVDTIAKENFLALGADGENAFAAWLDLRGNKRNKIVGAKSIDGGKTWSANQLIYASPDSTVCECCKPSVLVKGDHVYVMFRNWLNGSRDMYLAQSNDGGDHFDAPQKLGSDTWKLNGCPMDGGGMAINDKGIVQTTWRREGTIYSAVPGSAEHMIGTGKGCTIEAVNNQNVYAWANDGNIVLITPQQEQKIIGKGNLPQLKAIDNEHILCIWQDEKEIHSTIVKI